jgi:hypothetical protein
MWNIVKSLTGRKPHHEAIPDLNVFDKSYINTKMVADPFNKYFLSIAETITKSPLNNNDISNICNKANEYLTHSKLPSLLSIIVMLQQMKLVIL